MLENNGIKTIKISEFLKTDIDTICVRGPNAVGIAKMIKGLTDKCHL